LGAILRFLHAPYKALSLGGIYYLSALILPLLVVFPNLGVEGRIVMVAAYAIPVGVLADARLLGNAWRAGGSLMTNDPGEQVAAPWQRGYQILVVIWHMRG
jgi:hypothetical protein